MPRPKKEQEHIRTMINPNLHSLVVMLDATKKAIKSLQLKEKELVESVKIDVADMEGGKVIIESTEFASGPPYTVSLSDGSRSTIDRERLLERGVEPEIIAYATNKSEYTTLRITENKPKEEIKTRTRRSK